MRFKEWNTLQNGNGTAYQAGATVTMPASALTLYAIWEYIPPTVTSVAVNPSTVEVQKGTIQQFSVTVTGTNNPEQTVTWAVTGGGTGTSISTGGLLTVAAGETAATTLTVRATSTVDATKSGTATVTVTEVPPTITVTGVTVTPATHTLNRGETHTFSAEVLGTNAPQGVTWTVTGGGAGTSISEVGLLTVAAGETAVTLTVKATSTAAGYTDKFGTATVTVTQPAPTYTVTFNSNGGSAVSPIQNVAHGSKITAPNPPTKANYTFDGWYKDNELAYDWNFTTDVVTSDITLYAEWRSGSSSVAGHDREVPATVGGGEAVVVAPTNALSTEFTAGPNPVARSEGLVKFFRQGKRVDNATLTIYDAAGNVVNKIKIADKALGSQDRRQVGEWDLKDGKGRLVPEGTYLVRGVVKTGDGKRERVSVVVGVR
jgi:uncharacterized repeat protein (TIGR02543 family)